MTIIRYRIKVHFKGCPEKIFYFQSFDKKIDAINFVNQYKEIDLYSQQTISAKMKSARERNLCETTEELMAKYSKEKENDR